MQVFDPTRAMNAFTAGAQLGEGIRQRQTQAGLAPLVARGDYQAASQFAGERGDLQSAEMYRTQYMDALAQAGEQERQKDKEVRQGLASLALKGLNVPDDQIPAVVMQNADELRRLGFEDDKIQQWATPGVVTKPLLEGFLRDAQDLDQQISSYFASQQPAEPQNYASATDAMGVRRYTEGPNIGQPVPGFETPRQQQPQPGFSLQFGEGGSLQGLSYGTGGTGKEPAIVQTREGTAAVTPSPQQQSYNKAVRAVDEFAAQNSIVLGDIDRALEIIGPWSTGAGSALKNLPVVGGMTPAGQLESLIQTIAANVGFDKLQAMREASPTGGALGSVTERELAFLQSVFGSLRQDLKPENVRRNLIRLREHMVGRDQRIRAALGQDFPSLAQTAQFRSDTAQQIQDLTSVTDDDLMSILTGGQ